MSPSAETASPALEAEDLYLVPITSGKARFQAGVGSLGSWEMGCRGAMGIFLSSLGFLLPGPESIQLYLPKGNGDRGVQALLQLDWVSTRC